MAWSRERRPTYERPRMGRPAPGPELRALCRAVRDSVVLVDPSKVAQRHHHSNVELPGHTPLRVFVHVELVGGAGSGVDEGSSLRRRVLGVLCSSSVKELARRGLGWRWEYRGAVVGTDSVLEFVFTVPPPYTQQNVLKFVDALLGRKGLDSAVRVTLGRVEAPLREDQRRDIVARMRWVTSDAAVDPGNPIVWKPRRHPYTIRATGKSRRGRGKLGPYSDPTHEKALRLIEEERRAEAHERKLGALASRLSRALGLEHDQALALVKSRALGVPVGKVEELLRRAERGNALAASMLEGLREKALRLTAQAEAELGENTNTNTGC